MKITYIETIDIDILNIDTIDVFLMLYCYCCSLISISDGNHCYG